MPLGKRTDFGDARYCGVQVDFTSNIEDTLEASVSSGFDFIVAPLADPSRRPSKPSLRPAGDLAPPFLPSQVLHTMASTYFSNQIVGQISPWIQPDNPDITKQSLQSLNEEFAWAAHLSVQACLLPPPSTGMHCPEYCRAINQAIASGVVTMPLWIRIPALAEDIHRSGTKTSAPLDSMHVDTPTLFYPLVRNDNDAHVDVNATSTSINTTTTIKNTNTNNNNNNTTTSATNTSLQNNDPWEWWNTLRFACNHTPRISVALEISADLPSKESIDRWWGEPVKAFIVHTDAFLTNRRGYPTLSKRHQDVLIEAFKRNIQVIIAGESHHYIDSDATAVTTTTTTTNGSLYNGGEGGLLPPPPHAPPPPPPPLTSSISSLVGNQQQHTLDAHATPNPLHQAIDSMYPPLGFEPTLVSSTPHQHPLHIYWEYISFLFRKQPAMGAHEALEAPYRDFLQAPLQPLQDNLESQTYEVFERDATKYDVYSEAVRRALLDRVPESVAKNVTTVLMVVGAGRGPLVAASIAAGKAAGRKLRIYAVEKNPNAVVHVHARAARERWDNVTIIHADMRNWNAPEQADILVSELLGSFGDNELSPECLDGAQLFLKKDGISIPHAYTSYLHPITAHKLWVDVNNYNELKQFETPFVVKLHRFTSLAPPQQVFVFEHPNKDEHIDNNRSITLKFDCTSAGATVCHGFAGYFDTQLYKDVYLSIHPDTHTPNMFSWFPIFFPLRHPLRVPAHGRVEVSMWRCTSPHKVWYEWMAQCDGAVQSPIHNPNGRSYYVGL